MKRTPKAVPPALRFLLAARQSELRGLELLSHTCELVSRVGELVHALQKERGCSNLHLCGGHETPPPALAEYTRQAEEREMEVHRFLDGMLAAGGEQPGKARLFSCVAHALHRLDELADLRWRVRGRRIDAHEATTAFTRLIASLLAVVFEAADASLDPEITQMLVALLNFMQGKELSGQERAYGVMGYTAGFFSEEQKVRMAEFAAGQQRCFDTFVRYAPAVALPHWDQVALHTDAVLKLRAMALQTGPDQSMDPALAELWFDLCTARIDAMHPVERELTVALARQCAHRIEAARTETRSHRLLLDHFAQHVDGGAPALLFNVQRRVLDMPPADGVSDGIERSILDILREQADRMRQADQALAQARSALEERRQIERAKWVLVQRYGLTEPAAHQRLQRAAMDNSLSLAEVAQQILAQQGGAGS